MPQVSSQPFRATGLRPAISLRLGCRDWPIGMNHDVVDFGIPLSVIDQVAQREQVELESREELADEADEVVCLRSPDPFVAVGLWYRDFTPMSDDEVRTLLARKEP